MIYNQIITAKNQDKIPLFIDGRSIHSKYNPRNEKIAINQEAGFIIILGIGAGWHILNAIKELPKDCFLVAVEADIESLEFCKQFEAVKILMSKKNIALCTAQNIENVILNNYIPALYGNLFVAVQRAWETECSELCSKIKISIQNVLKQISADFSVQSHFGKIWQRNIFLNLLIY